MADIANNLAHTQAARLGGWWTAMRQAILIVVVLAFAGCDDAGYSPRDLVACGTKAMDALGPAPPACSDDSSDYLKCRSDTAIAITEYERKHGLYVQDCMEAAGYKVSDECSAEWKSLVNLPQCYY